MSPPVQPEISDRDLYDRLRDHGLSHTQAVQHVERRRMGMTPAEPDQSVMGPWKTGLQAAGQTIADIGVSPLRIANQLAGALSTVVGESPERADRSVAAVNAILDRLTRPSSPELQDLVSRSQAANPVATTLGSAGTALLPLVYAGGRYVKGKLTAASENAALRSERLAGQRMRNQILEQRLARGRPTTVSVQPEPTPLVGNMSEATIRTQLQKQGFRPEDIERAVATAKGQPSAPVSNLGLSPRFDPIPGTTRGYTAVGPPTMPVTPAMEALSTMQGNGPTPLARTAPKPGHPVWFGDESPTRSAEVRGGERLLPKAVSTGELLRRLEDPSLSEADRAVVRATLAARGIVGRGITLPLDMANQGEMDQP